MTRTRAPVSAMRTPAFFTEKEVFVMPILATTAQMQALDRAAIEQRGIPSLTLMENAAAALAKVVLSCTGTACARVAVFCGPGNNGGDGLAVARLLAKAGCRVRCLLLGDPARLTHDSAIMARRLEEVGLSPLPYDPYDPETQRCLQDCDVVVDALFGVGLRRPLQGAYLAAVRQINAVSCPVVACDLPSGIDGDTGQRLGDAVQADCTVTFTCGKPGLYRGAGAACAGTVHIAPIGIPDDLLQTLA